jgi:molybdopterin-binding protein
MLRGKIVKINTIGAVVRIEIDCGFPLLGIVTVDAAEELDLTFGKPVYASFKATAVKVIKRWS